MGSNALRAARRAASWSNRCRVLVSKRAGGRMHARLLSGCAAARTPGLPNLAAWDSPRSNFGERLQHLDHRARPGLYLGQDVCAQQQKQGSGRYSAWEGNGRAATARQLSDSPAAAIRLTRRCQWQSVGQPGAGWRVPQLKYPPMMASAIPANTCSAALAATAGGRDEWSAC